jgi:hypothetical protein
MWIRPVALEVQFRTQGISPEALSRVIGRAGPAGVSAANKAARDQASLLIAGIRRNASGRPGPNAPTGDYRRSWNKRPVPGGWVVGTASPQAARLEYGFWMKTDRLGRGPFRQPVRPHVRPAVRIIERTFPVAVMAAVRRSLAISGSTGVPQQ